MSEQIRKLSSSELIKALRTCAGMDCAGCPLLEKMFDGADCANVLMLQTADILEKAMKGVVPMDFHERCLRLEIEKRVQLEEKQQWISVKDRLPEAGKILVTDGKTVTISNGAWLYRSLEGKTRVPANYGAGLTVTHWMPLPEPPKEEER